MSWNGTVTCSYCWQKGHNRRGCDKEKADIQERRELYGDNDWKVQSYDMKRSRTSRKGEKRSCTYCGDMGHNRRTCSILKEHVAVLQKASTIWRREFVTMLEASGLGVGSILNHEHWRGDTTRYIVTGINWDGLHWCHNSSPFKVRNLTQLTAGDRGMSAPRSCFEHADNLGVPRTSTDVTILVAKPAINIPDGWVEEGMSVKQAKAYLKERSSWGFTDYGDTAAAYRLVANMHDMS